MTSTGLETNNGVKAMNPEVWKPRQATGRRLRDTIDEETLRCRRLTAGCEPIKEL